ncbi:anti-sigma factor domain-containing protein [Tabrizicola sp.]|uniref:anti-sigma factor n=1 Tax=Tabrizicola sp. TaxID=2005166 RepID=UPI00286BFAF8|nr:anti-sigma factor [Tabrizicola sp.]
MTDAPLTPQEEDEALAAEYVLGVLDIADRSAVEARVKKDSAFAARIAAWENRLAGLNEGFAEAPVPNLLPKIEARLFPTAPRQRRGYAGWFAGVAVAAALAMVSFSLIAPPRPDVVATLSTKDTRLSYQVSHFSQTLTVTRVAGSAAPEGQVHQLWIIAPGNAPVSLGLLAGETLVVHYPTPPAGWLLAVSVEPEGGSASGLPSGPVILSALVSTDA